MSQEIQQKPEQSGQWKATDDWCPVCDWNHDPKDGCVDAALKSSVGRLTAERDTLARRVQELEHTAAKLVDLLDRSTIYGSSDRVREAAEKVRQQLAPPVTGGPR